MDKTLMRGLNEIKANAAILQPHLGEVPVSADDHTSPDSRRGGPMIRTEKEAKGKDTHRLIIDIAEKLFRQLGGVVVGVAAVIDLPELGGSAKLRADGLAVHTLCEFSEEE